MANNNQIYKMSNAGGFKSLNRYYDMLAGNSTWNPWSPTGAYDALATITVPSGGAASVTFSGIPTGYKHLQIRYLLKCNSINWNYIRYNGDTGANYTFHAMYGTGSSALAGAGTGYTGWAFDYNNSGTAWQTGIIDILDYASTTKNKTGRCLHGFDENGSGIIELNSGAWLSTAAITSIKIDGATTIDQYSQFALYGVK